MDVLTHVHRDVGLLVEDALLLVAESVPVNVQAIAIVIVVAHVLDVLVLAMVVAVLIAIAPVLVKFPLFTIFNMSLDNKNIV